MSTITIKSPEELSGMGLGPAELAYNDAKKFVKDNPDSAIQAGVAIANENTRLLMGVLKNEIHGKDNAKENKITKDSQIPEIEEEYK